MADYKKIYTEEEVHSAMGTIAGFIYQFYYFLYKLLTAEYDSITSFELYDDVAENKVGGVTLYQLKHTISANFEKKLSKDERLTNRAPEMWKALNVWQQIIINKNKKTGRGRTPSEQKNFIATHDFVLVCNKNAESNFLVDLCGKLRNDKTISDDEIDRVLKIITEEQKKKSLKSCDVKRMHKTVQSMIDELKNFPYKKDLLAKISFEHTKFEDIEKKCVDHICGTLFFLPEHAKDVLDDFLTEVVKDLKENSKKGNPLTYTYTERMKRFACVFQYARETKLRFPYRTLEYQPNFMDLVCIKQLVKVNDINLTKNGYLDKVVRYVSQFYSFKNHYEEYRGQYIISETEDQTFRNEAITVWYNEFVYRYEDLPDDISEKEIREKAKELLHTVREHDLILKQPLGLNISNGVFYYLSDECLIGWHPKWKEFFKK